MGKDTHLVNIYLKIHNKQTLTMDDLRYLAQYSPECFEKTCKNVVYNIPETKTIMEATDSKTLEVETRPEPAEQQNIEQILENIKGLETNEFSVSSVDADEVKSLLGNLYMELLFPHNDKDTFFNMANNGDYPSFDKRI